MSLDNIGGVNNAAQGIKYDKTDIQKTMMKESSIVRQSENENGKFVEIIDTETGKSYLLADRDFDGVFDDCRMEIDDGNPETRTVYDDDDFDGTFDSVTSFRNLDNGDTLMAVDRDADGEVDDILYLESMANRAAREAKDEGMDLADIRQNAGVAPEEDDGIDLADIREEAGVNRSDDE